MDNLEIWMILFKVFSILGIVAVALGAFAFSSFRTAIWPMPYRAKND